VVDGVYRRRSPQLRGEWQRSCLPRRRFGGCRGAAVRALRPAIPCGGGGATQRPRAWRRRRAPGAGSAPRQRRRPPGGRRALHHHDQSFRNGYEHVPDTRPGWKTEQSRSATRVPPRNVRKPAASGDLLPKVQENGDGNPAPSASPHKQSWSQDRYRSRACRLQKTITVNETRWETQQVTNARGHRPSTPATCRKDFARAELYGSSQAKCEPCYCRAARR